VTKEKILELLRVGKKETFGENEGGEEQYESSHGNFVGKTAMEMCRIVYVAQGSLV
jgi:hypothetical protein